MWYWESLTIKTVEEIKADVGSKQITHMIINAESLPQVIEIAQGVTHLKLDNTKEYPSLSGYVTYSYMYM